MTMLDSIFHRVDRLIDALDSGPCETLDRLEYLYLSVKTHAHQELGVACSRCGGSGVRMYGSGRTWRTSGMGTASCTDDVCDLCWGTGRKDKIGLDLLELWEKSHE